QRIVAAGSNVTDFRDDQGTNRSGYPEIPRTGSGVVMIGNELFYYHGDSSRQFANRMRRGMKGGDTSAPDQRPNNPQPDQTRTSLAPITTQGAAPSPITGTLWQGIGAPRSGHRHAGFDIGAPEGTPIYSMGPGTVIRSGFQGGITGGIVVIRYDNGIEAKY